MMEHRVKSNICNLINPSFLVLACFSYLPNLYDY
uniref:Uncharacterized protein n=1 Tax=Arundo donax TaxID=35708 RepID=A0A0A9C1L8_ARUDO